MNQIRKVIEINETLCDGCGDCITGCPEGAIQLVEGKAKLMSDTYCDGLGACVGDCPQGAIQIIEREAAPYNEELVIANIMKQGPLAVKQHLQHLQEHGELEYLAQAQAYLESSACGCPGSAARSFKSKASSSVASDSVAVSSGESALTHWPVQMHLINPLAPHFHGSDFLLSADCVAFTVAGFHSQYLKGKTLGIACPKLDDGMEVYLNKIKALVEQAKINTLTVMIMQVPCCQGLLRLAKQAVQSSSRKIPIKTVIISVDGNVLSEEWV